MLEALRLLEEPSLRGPSSAIGVPFAAAAAASDDDEPFAGIPAEHVEGVAAEFAGTSGEGPEADECDSAAAAAEEADPAHGEEESEPDGEAAVLEAAAAAAIVPAAGLFDTAAYAAAVVDDKVYVTCPVPPWSELTHVGQITSWPKDKPLENGPSAADATHTGSAKRRLKRECLNLGSCSGSSLGLASPCVSEAGARCCGRSMRKALVLW